MLIYNESHIRAVLRTYTQHYNRTGRTSPGTSGHTNALSKSSCRSVRRYGTGRVLGSVINEAPPCRVNDSMKLQVRHHHEFEAVHAGISHEAQGLTDTVLCPPAIEASPSMSRRIRRGLR